MLQLLLESTQDSEQREYTLVAHQSAESLLRLLNDILDLSRLNADKLPIESTPFAVGSVVEEVIELFVPEAAAKGLELAYHVAPSVPPQVIGDPARLRQVLINLVGNAVKFTEQGEVSVTAIRTAHGDLAFDISDTGIGIDPQIGDQLFETFSQADGSSSRRYGGSGLGLAIVRQLCTLMGGRVSYRSKPGTGSRFSVRLPLAAIDSGTAPTPGANLKGCRLLLADQGPVVRAAFSDLLAGSGAEIDCRESVAEALLQITAHDESPDLFLVDAKLLAKTDLATRQQLVSLWQEANVPQTLPGALVRVMARTGAEVPHRA